MFFSSHKRNLTNHDNSTVDMISDRHRTGGRCQITSVLFFSHFLSFSVIYLLSPLLLTRWFSLKMQPEPFTEGIVTQSHTACDSERIKIMYNLAFHFMDVWE